MSRRGIVTADEIRADIKASGIPDRYRRPDRTPPATPLPGVPVIGEWRATYCTACGYIGPAAGHRCDHELAPVVIRMLAGVA